RQKKAKTTSPRQAAMLLARPPEKLKPDEQRWLAQLTAAYPEVSTLYDLTQSFVNVFRSQQGEALQNWLTAAKASGLPDLGNHLKPGHTLSLQNRPTEVIQNKSSYT
ncbi:MAG TPA: transposase, partial [Candidatus Obscuribacterales bacterium]